MNKEGIIALFLLLAIGLVSTLIYFQIKPTIQASPENSNFVIQDFSPHWELYSGTSCENNLTINANTYLGLRNALSNKIKDFECYFKIGDYKNGVSNWNNENALVGYFNPKSSYEITLCCLANSLLYNQELHIVGEQTCRTQHLESLC